MPERKRRGASNSTDIKCNVIKEERNARSSHVDAAALRAAACIVSWVADNSLGLVETGKRG